MKPQISLIMKIIRIPFVSMILVFAVGTATAQGKGRKVGTPPVVVNVPGVPGGGKGARQRCVQACNAIHHNAQICRGRKGRDRASCQQSINQQHRNCIQSCPK